MKWRSLENAMKELGDDLVREYKDALPVATGNLRDSVSADVS